MAVIEHTYLDGGVRLTQLKPEPHTQRKKKKKRHLETIFLLTGD